MIRFIADLCSNHNQDISRAKKLIRIAKTCGVWAIKFQLFSAETLYAPCCIKEREIAKKREFPIEWIPELYEYSHREGMRIGYSIFHESFIDKVIKYTDFLKISSWDTLRLDLIRKCISTNLQVMISLGAVSEKNLKEIFLLRYATEASDPKNPLILFHCAPKYPTKPEECNLSFIPKLRYLDHPIGWSDHSGFPGVIYKAISYGASIIEFHLDLADSLGWENLGRAKHCWTPSGISRVINDIQIGEEAIGTKNLKEIEEQFKVEGKYKADPSDGFRPTVSMRNKIESLNLK